MKRGSSTHCGCLTSEIQSQARRGEYGVSLRNRVIDTYRRNAKKKNNECLLTDEQFDQLFSMDCFYCGCSPSKTIKRKDSYGEFTYNGIDRKNPDFGYVIENCVSCCANCNFMKNSMSYNDYIKRCNLIAKNHPIDDISSFDDEFWRF